MITDSDRLREERDALMAKIDELNGRINDLTVERNRGITARFIRMLNHQIDACSNEIGLLMDQLFEVEAELERADPEPRVYGRDGL